MRSMAVDNEENAENVTCSLLIDLRSLPTKLFCTDHRIQLPEHFRANQK